MKTRTKSNTRLEAIVGTCAWKINKERLNFETWQKLKQKSKVKCAKLSFRKHYHYYMFASSPWTTIFFKLQNALWDLMKLCPSAPGSHWNILKSNWPLKVALNNISGDLDYQRSPQSKWLIYPWLSLPISNETDIC